MGFPNVRVLEGGLQAWQEAGGTLAQGGRPQPAVPDVAPGIDAADLLASMNSSHPPVVLDLGSSLRYQRRHVPGAHWLSRGWLEDAVPRHLPDRSCALVLTGASWPQMQLAAASLAALGYGDVRVLRASVEQWAGEGCPVARGMDSAWSEVRDVANAGILRGDRDAMRRYLDWEIALTAA